MIAANQRGADEVTVAPEADDPTTEQLESEGEPVAPADATDEADEQAEAPAGSDLGPGFAGEHVTAGPLASPPPLLRTPRADGSAFEAALHTANATARAASLARLETWFAGYDFAAAAQTTDDRRFTLLNIGDALYDHLDALAAVESHIARQVHPGQRLRFSHGDEAKRGQRPAYATDGGMQQPSRLKPGPLVRAMREGWTTILNGFDEFEPKLAGVTADMERVYGCRINTNVYLSWGEALGFGAHWDNHDTIIVPAAGNKTWRVFEPTALSPMRPWVGPEVSGRAVWEGVAAPGTCLVIPRGWGHEVVGSDDLAIHYTIGVNRLTVASVVDHLRSEVGYQPIARADVVYDLEGESSSYDHSIHDSESGLADMLAEIASPELLDRAIATERARMPKRTFPMLFDTWVATGLGSWEDAELQLGIAAGVQVAGEDGVELVAFGGRQVALSEAARNVVQLLADGEPKPIAALAAVTESIEMAEAVATELVDAGLATVVTGP